jgi:hypothetical protein
MERTIEANEGEPELSGVRGWLLTLALLLMVAMPLVAVLGLIGAWQSAAGSPALRTSLIAATAVELGLAGFAAYAGWALHQVRLHAVRIAKAYFIVTLVLGIFGLGLAALAQPDAPDIALLNMLRGPAALAGLRQILLSAVCLAYLQRSKRVRSTYPRGSAQTGNKRGTLG